MAANVYDFKLRGVVGGQDVATTGDASTQTGAVASGTAASISPGDLVVYANGYWAKVADGGASSAGKYGMAMSTSTETASADGTVKVVYHPNGLIVQGSPTTAGNLAQAVIGDLVTLDVDGSGNQTVDENAPTGVLQILSYDDSVSGDETVDIVVPYGTTPA